MPRRGGWFKSWDDEVEDPKVQRLTDGEYRVWRTCLNLCNRSPARLRERGYLYHSVGFPVEPEDVARVLARPVEEVQAALDRLCEIGGDSSLMLVEEVEDRRVLRVRAWRKRQRGGGGRGEEIEGGEAAGEPEAGRADATHAQTARQAGEPEAGRADATHAQTARRNPKTLPVSSQSPPKMSPPDVDVDVRRRRKTETWPGRRTEGGGPEGGAAPSDAAPAPRPTWPAEAAALKSIPGYRFDETKDRALMDALAEAYGGLDLAHELRKLKAWLAGNGLLPLKGQARPRARIRRWMQNADRWDDQGGRSAGADRGTPRRHAPARAEEFRETGRIDL